MCDETHEYGIKIMVETVVGYMGSDDDHVGVYDDASDDPMDHVNPRTAELESELLAARTFHTPYVECALNENYYDGYSDYDIEASLTSIVK